MSLELENRRKNKTLLLLSVLEFSEKVAALTDDELLRESATHCVFDSPSYEEALFEELAVRFAEKVNTPAAPQGDFLKCRECGRPADYWKGGVIFQNAPLYGADGCRLPGQMTTVAYHQACAPLSINMRAISGHLRRQCPIIAKCLRLREVYGLSYRAALELMVVALAENNTTLHNQLIQE